MTNNLNPAAVQTATSFTVSFDSYAIGDSEAKHELVVAKQGDKISILADNIHLLTNGKPQVDTIKLPAMEPEEGVIVWVVPKGGDVILKHTTHEDAHFKADFCGGDIVVTFHQMEALGPEGMNLVRNLD